MALMKITPVTTGFELTMANPIQFKSLPLPSGVPYESHLEELIAKNTELLSGDDAGPEDTMLILGRQVQTSTNKRMDLVALDGTGATVVIEVKRDLDDVKARKDHGEMQAIRYAASLAQLQTKEELVLNLLVPFFNANAWAIQEDKKGPRSVEEYARLVLDTFLDQNQIPEEALNHRQRLILVGAKFDADTTSAAAWLAANGLPIEVFEVSPHQIVDGYFLNVERVIPPPSLEEFYTNLLLKGPGSTPSKKGDSSRVTRIRMSELISNGVVKMGDILHFKGGDIQKTCSVVDASNCSYLGQTLSYLAWAKQMSGWQAVNIYQWLIHEPTNQRLEDIRVALEAELAKKDSAE